MKDVVTNTTATDCQSLFGSGLFSPVSGACLTVCNMVAHRISRFSGEFASTAEEQAYLAEIWPQTVLYLRIITIITVLGMLFSFYLYYLLFGTDFQTAIGNQLQLCW